MITDAFGQSSSRPDRLTKQEFRELLNNKDNFIPRDLGDTVIIVKYSTNRLLEIRDLAQKYSLAKHGVDTTRFENQISRTQVARDLKVYNKFSSDQPLRLKKQLMKKGITSIIIDEENLPDDRYKYYWIKTIFNSTQQSPKEGYILYSINYFYDPNKNIDYEILLPINRKLLDLIDEHRR